MRPENNQPQKKPPSQAIQAAMGLGYQLTAAIIIFAGSGYFLDTRFGGGYLFTLIGISLTFLYGGYEVWKLVKMMEQDDRDKSEPKQR